MSCMGRYQTPLSSCVSFPDAHSFAMDEKEEGSANARQLAMV
jgi:hypothetical protein